MPSAAEKSIIIIGDGAVFLILLYPKCVSHRMAKTKMDLGSGASDIQPFNSEKIFYCISV